MSFQCIRIHLLKMCGKIITPHLEVLQGEQVNFVVSRACPSVSKCRIYFSRRRPVAFGKISYAPSKNKINPDYLMTYLHNGPQTAQPRRRPATSFRLPGGGNIIPNYPPQAGSFDHLKVNLSF